jgi:GWxTD domain-containing protein
VDKLYWMLTDPLSLTPQNEHRLEFLSRVTYAELRWTSDDLDLRGADTDRGDIHIRYGPPPVLLSLAGGGDAFSNSEMWMYGRGLSFVFSMPPTWGTGRFSGDYADVARRVRAAEPVRWDNLPINKTLDSIPVFVARFRAGADSTDVFLSADVPVTSSPRGSTSRASRWTSTSSSSTGPRPVRARLDARGRERGADPVQLRAWRNRVGPGTNVYRVEALQPDALVGRARHGQRDLGRRARLRRERRAARRARVAARRRRAQPLVRLRHPAERGQLPSGADDRPALGDVRPARGGRRQPLPRGDHPRAPGEDRHLRAGRARGRRDERRGGPHRQQRPRPGDAPLRPRGRRPADRGGLRDAGPHERAGRTLQSDRRGHRPRGQHPHVAAHVAQHRPRSAHAIAVLHDPPAHRGHALGWTAVAMLALAGPLRAQQRILRLGDDSVAAARGSAADSAAAARVAAANADALLARGDSAGALRALERVVLLRPDDAAAWHRRGLLGWALFGTGPRFQRIDDVASDSKRKLLEDADVALKRAVGFAPDSARFAFDLGRFHLAGPAFHPERMLVLAAFDQALSTTRRLRGPAAFAEMADSMATLFWRRYERVAERQVVQTGRYAALAGEMADTVTVATRSFRVPGALPGWAGQMDYMLAEELLRAAALADSGNARVRRHLLRHLVERERWADLRTEARRQQRLAPADPWPWLAGGLAEHRSDGATAAAAFDRALQAAGPADSARLVSMARILPPADAAA